MGDVSIQEELVVQFKAVKECLKKRYVCLLKSKKEWEESEGEMGSIKCKWIEKEREMEDKEEKNENQSQSSVLFCQIHLEDLVGDDDDQVKGKRSRELKGK